MHGKKIQTCISKPLSWKVYLCGNRDSYLCVRIIVLGKVCVREEISSRAGLSYIRLLYVVVLTSDVYDA